MSNLATNIASAGALVAQNSPRGAGTEAKGSEARSAQTNTSQQQLNAGATSAAAIVSLSDQSRRIASYGEARRTDSSFAANRKDEKKKDEVKEDSGANAQPRTRLAVRA